MENSHGDRGHALCGGSTAYIWSVCYGAVHLWKQVEPEEAGEAAREGTLAHEVAERTLRAWVAHRRTGSAYDGPDTSDEYMRAIVSQYVDAMDRIVFQGTVTDRAILFEEKLTLREGLSYGYVDVAEVHIDDKGKRAGWIVDYKHGRMPVEAEGNAQLAFYAVGLRNLLTSRGKPLDYVDAMIYQPRSEDETEKITHFTGKQLDTWEAKFNKALDAIEAGDTKTKAGEHCTWCKARGICPMYRKKLFKDAALPGVSLLPPVEHIPIEQLVRIYIHRDALEDFLSRVSAYLHDMAVVRGQVPEGLKVVESRTRRKWIDDEDPAMIEAVNDVVGVDATRRKLLPLTHVEKMMRKEERGALDQFIEKTQASMKLVPLDDKRESVGKTGMALLSNEDIGI